MTAQRKWTDSERDYLRTHYPQEGIAEIARVLGREYEAVRRQAGRLGLRRSQRWTRAEDAELHLRYSLEPTDRLARRLGREPGAVRARARYLEIADGRRRRWTAAEIAVLEAEYTRVSMPALARRLRRSVQSVRGQARRLGLRQTPPLAAESEELLWEMREQPGVVEYFGRHFGASAAAIRRVLRRMEEAGGPQTSIEPAV